ncbi:DUF1800 domain-containing protein [Ohtaekwangia sp.]|uniref:DUF1800 domain-containing protein n=1 Tax=Ohtaekwangia sp. TaxID=2066019 RepID=UPI002FDE4521
MPLPEYGGALGQKRAAHLLRRATFGATKQQIDSFAALTPAQAITQLFRQTLSDPVLPIDPKTGSEWVTTGTTGANSENRDLMNYLLGWFLGQMMNSSLAYSAREKIVHFLHTHFTMRTEKVGNTRSIYYQNQLFRQFALDATSANAAVNFKTLTVKVSVDNAMLELLDGKLNVKGSFNENYARELLELYSIGRGLEVDPPATSGQEGDYGVYTEDDVKTAARILTGWDVDDTYKNIDPDTNLPRGKVKGSETGTNASSHDNDETKPKKFSSNFKSTLFPDNTITPDPLLMPAGTPTEDSALDEITKLIDLIYEQDETARHICRKVYRFFVWAPHTKAETDPIEANVIEEMANTFKANNFKLQPVIENLLRSQHFYDAAAGVTDDGYGGLIKSPIDLIIGTLKFFNVQLPDLSTQTEQFYAMTSKILSEVENLGMAYYNPYDVAGYEAYHQFPVFHRYWITTSSLSKRYIFIEKLLDATAPLDPLTVNSYEFIKANFAGVAANAEALVKELVIYLLPHHDDLTFTDGADTTASLTAKRLIYFKKRFLTDVNTDPEGYWTTTWNAGTDLEELRLWLNRLLNTILQSPEYQLA